MSLQNLPTRFCRRVIPAFLLAASLAVPARAEPLNPLDFPSLGARVLPAGAYTINTDTLVLSGPNATTIVGTLYANSIAVFSFDSLIVSGGASIAITGSRPAAILSAGDLQLPCSISANGNAGGNSHPIAIGVEGGLGGTGGPATVVITGHTGTETTSCPADFNQNGRIDVQDIFSFLSAWFAGCP